MIPPIIDGEEQIFTIDGEEQIFLSEDGMAQYLAGVLQGLERDRIKQGYANILEAQSTGISESSQHGDLGEFSDTLHTLKDEIEGRAHVRQMITTLKGSKEL